MTFDNNSASMWQEIKRETKEDLGIISNYA